MRFLIVGLGSIGRRHLAAIRHVHPEAGIIVLRRKGQALDNVAPEGVTVLDDWEAALEREPTAAIVANPAPRHLASGLALAEAGLHLLIEKPLADHLAGIDALLGLCRERNRVLLVGYCLRYDPSLQAFKAALDRHAIGRLVHLRIEVGQYLPDWRPETDYRQSVSARADLGGGVLLELSHEIDAALWLAGMPSGIMARLSQNGGLGIEVEDCADVLLDWPHGLSGSLHLDFLQRTPVRRYTAIGREGTLTWDGIERATRLYRAGDADAGWTILHPGGAVPRDRLFHAQIAHFVACMERRETPLVSGEDGRKVLAVVEAARRSTQQGRIIHP